MKKFLAFALTLAMLLSFGVIAFADDRFDWEACEGTTIQVAVVEHNVSSCIEAKIDQFTEKTGIMVELIRIPEAYYFDKLSAALSGRSGSVDLFMSGAYQLWDYSAAGYVEDLTPYLDKAFPGYGIEDFFQPAINALKWDGIPGHPVGSGSQLGLPLCFEIYSLAYNKRAFEEKGLKVPATYDELITVSEALKGWNGPGSYGLAVRGHRDWGTIHPGYMSFFTAFGAKDFEIENGKLVSRLDSPEAIAMTEWFVDLVKRGGPPFWENYTWVEAGNDLGSGKAAMLIDADLNGLLQNWIKDGKPSSAEAGNIAWAPLPVAKPGDPVYSNFWTWSMGMNANSDAKEAAWLFLQYFTSKDFCTFASVNNNNLDPVRTSVWENRAFQSKMKQHKGYIDTFNKTIDTTSIYFTPQPEFFVTTTEWAATLQDLVLDGGDVGEAMRELAAEINKTVEYIDLSSY